MLSSGQLLEVLLFNDQFRCVAFSSLMASSLFHSILFIFLLSIRGIFAFTWHILLHERTFTYKKKDNYSESTINNNYQCWVFFIIHYLKIARNVPKGLQALTVTRVTWPVDVCMLSFIWSWNSIWRLLYLLPSLLLFDVCKHQFIKRGRRKSDNLYPRSSG